MEKVKITQEQADAIESLRSDEYDDDVIIRNVLFYEMRTWLETDNNHRVLGEVRTDTLIRALYIGYEVETEFKIGDWVVHEFSGEVVKIIGISEEDGKTCIKIDAYTTGYLFLDDFRRATPEEIAKEKQRRWWGKHDRDVWELVPLDVIKTKSTHEIFYVDYFGKDYVGLFSYDKEKDITTKIEDIKANYLVVCFREDRKDVANAK